MVQVIDTGKHWLHDEHKDSQSIVNLISESGKDNLRLDTEKLILLRSSGNYVEVYFRSGESTHKSLIRQTLTTLESQILEFPQFHRSHRCCLINADYIDRMIATTVGWSIKLEGIEFDIPIARGKINAIRKLVSNRKVT